MLYQISNAAARSTSGLICPNLNVSFFGGRAIRYFSQDTSKIAKAENANNIFKNTLVDAKAGANIKSNPIFQSTLRAWSCLTLGGAVIGAGYCSFIFAKEFVGENPGITDPLYTAIGGSGHALAGLWIGGLTGAVIAAGAPVTIPLAIHYMREKQAYSRSCEL